MTEDLILEPLLERHWEKVRSIYLEGIATGHATFQQSAPHWKEWDEMHLQCCRLIARRADEIVGWAALSPVSPRPVYAGVAEVSIYVTEGARGEGVGSQLLSGLIASSEAAGLWTLQAGIFAENLASRALHKNAGFREVGVRERLGSLHGLWRDIVLMERRSKVVGSSPGEE